MYYSNSASVSLGSGNSVRYISYLHHFLTLCLLFFLMYLTRAGLQVAQTNLSHFPLSTRRYLHVKPHHLAPSPNLQEKRQLKGRQRQQGKRRRRKFPCHMIARQWVLEARPPLRRTALPHKLEAKESCHFRI